MTALYRCELAKALLYSPVAPDVPEDARHLLRWLLTLTEAQAMDPEQLTVPERERWTGAGRPAGLPAVIAAQVWADRATDVRAAIAVATAEALAQVHAAQLLTSAGFVELDRRSGQIVSGFSFRAWPRAASHPSRVRVRLSEVYSAERIRGLLLGPLAAWPLDP